jgi:F-type H+-transporting ATPase subunit epsilon
MVLPKQLRFVLVTPEKTLLDERVDLLRFPLYDGQIGILPGRAPLVGRLGYGDLKIGIGSDERHYFVDGGFVQVKGEIVTLLTNRAIPSEQIDRQAAEEQLREANSRVAHSPHEFLTKSRDVERARRLVSMARGSHS